ncbi:MAG: response regulator [Myxococcales bacterium]|nr:response regulator [Myxococcales bacterium]
MPDVRVLLVEDSEVEVALLQRAAQIAGVTLNMHVVTTGEEALEQLQAWSKAATPTLVLLDLNLPGMDGQAVLERIRRDTSTAHLPVIVLTSSTFDGDVRRSYELGANAFISKPFGLDETVAMVQSLHDFWLSQAALP